MQQSSYTNHSLTWNHVWSPWLRLPIGQAGDHSLLINVVKIVTCCHTSSWIVFGPSPAVSSQYGVQEFCRTFECVKLFSERRYCPRQILPSDLLFPSKGASSEHQSMSRSYLFLCSSRGLHKIDRGRHKGDCLWFHVPIQTSDFTNVRFSDNTCDIGTAVTDSMILWRIRTLEKVIRHSSRNLSPFRWFSSMRIFFRKTFRQESNTTTGGSLFRIRSHKILDSQLHSVCSNRNGCT